MIPNNLEEKLFRFVEEIKEKEDLIGVRVYIEYPLVEREIPSWILYMVRPTIIYQATNGEWRVFAQHREYFESYVPIETKSDPEKVARIGKLVEDTARRIAEYTSSQGIKVTFCKQNPPTIEILYLHIKEGYHKPGLGKSLV